VDAPPAAEPAPWSFTPAGRNHLFVPGPTNINDRVLRAMNIQGMNHRDPSFGGLVEGLLEDLKYLYKTDSGTPFIFPATGTGAWESALVNCLSPGDKVVAFRKGTFSHLWCLQAEKLGLDVHIIDTPWGEGADEAELEKVLKADVDKKIKAVLLVHNETTCGVTSDVAQCREAMDAAGHPALFFVDGVSSIGALEFKFDDWKVDVAITGSQKALSLPPGLALTCVSDKALEARKTSTMPKFFFELDQMIEMNAQNNFPYTPAIPLLHGLREALDMLMEEGIDNVIARHTRFGEGTRKAVEAWGLDLLCANPRWNSNSLTVIKTPPGVDSGNIVKTAYCKYNLSLGVGLMKVQGQVFRIGHLGDMNEVSLLGALAGAEMTMRDVGMDIAPGSGVGAAVEYFQATSKTIPTRDMEGVMGPGTA
jgi:alanine-glyoxylate transaminase/serine-glyoxylate transaminase/serine-pyruvate transaminase